METLSKFINDVTNFIGTAVANLLLTLAVAVFFWAVINFLAKRSQGASDGMKQARDMLGWSIVGLFVMFSVWGIIYFFQDAFQITNKNSISAPSIKVNVNNNQAGTDRSTYAPNKSNLKQKNEKCISSSQCSSDLICRQAPGEARGTLTCN
jgi:Type IV secretion system pilin